MSEIPSNTEITVAPSRARRLAPFVVVVVVLAVGAITVWNWKQKVVQARLDVLRTVERALAIYASSTGTGAPADDWQHTLATCEKIPPGARHLETRSGRTRRGGSA